MVSPYGNQMIAEVAAGLRGSDYGRSHRAQVDRIERAARPYADRLGATSGWGGGGLGPDQLRRLQARIDAGRYDDTQTARLFNSLERNMGGFVSALESGNLLNYVDRVAGAPAPAPRRTPPRSSPPPAAPRRTPPRSSPPPAAARTAPPPPPQATGDETDEVPAAPPPAAEPQPVDYIESAANQTQGEDPDLEAAGRTFVDGFGEELTSLRIGARQNTGEVLSALVTEDAELAERIGSEIQSQGLQVFRQNVETFLNGRPASGDQPAVEAGDLQFLIQNNPAIARALVPALARSNPDFGELMIGEGLRPIVSGLPDELQDQYEPLIGRMGPSLGAALQDPETAAIILENAGNMFGDGDTSDLTREERIALLDDMMAKPDLYVNMLSSRNPVGMINGLSDDAYPVFARANAPSGFQAIMMRMVFGSDFDPMDPNNREPLAWLSCQMDAITGAISELSAERECIAANGGGGSFSFSAITDTVRMATSLDDRDMVRAAGIWAADDAEWAAAHGITEPVSLLTVNARTQEVISYRPAASDDTAPQTPDVPGTRRPDEPIETVDPDIAFQV